MEARVQIMKLDQPNHNGRIYPRGVMEKALAKLKGQSLAVIHVNSLLKNEGVPKMSDSLGVASGLAIDESNSTVLASVKIEQVPSDLLDGFVMRSAGFGVLEGNVVTEFSMSCVVLDPVAPGPRVKCPNCGKTTDSTNLCARCHQEAQGW
jgi:hypothetical protein